MNHEFPVRKSLLSFSNKHKALELAEVLSKWGSTIYASQGTSNFLLERGIQAHSLEGLIGFSSLLGGRIKTLHTSLFASVLAQPKDETELLGLGIPKMDLIAIDFYPLPEGEGVESIDIGGPALLRAAAKNYHFTVPWPGQLPAEALDQQLQNYQGKTTLEFRRQLAAAVYAKTAEYDTKVLSTFPLPESELRYGENPHQKALFCGDRPWQCLQGKQLSYNNLLDLDAAHRLIQEFSEPAFAILKHQNPCGVASGSRALELLAADAIAADPEARFGGVVVLNQPLTPSVALLLNEFFLECVQAPHFTPEALEILKPKKNLRLVEVKEVQRNQIVRSAFGGLLFQREEPNFSNDPLQFDPAFEFPGQPTTLLDLRFALRVVKHCRSNAVVIARDGVSLGFGIGQTSRVRSVRLALDQATTKGTLQGAVLASDGFFPFADSIALLEGLGLAGVVAPRGSIRDGEVIEACQRKGIPLYFATHRYFSH